MQPHDQQPNQHNDPLAQAQPTPAPEPQPQNQPFNTHQPTLDSPTQHNPQQAVDHHQQQTHQTTNAVAAVEHISNPYVTTTDGLVTILKTNPVAAMLSVVLGLLASLPFLIPMLLTTNSSSEPSPLNAVFTLLWYLALVPLVGGTSVAVASASAQDKTITTRQALRTAMQKALPFIGLAVLTFLIAAGGMLLLTVPGLIVIARASLASIILFEENVGPMTAIKRSFALTKGHFFEMWGAIIASGFMTGGGLLSPASSVAPILARYRQYKSIEAGKTTANKVHWLNYFNFFVPFILIGLIVSLMAIGAKSAIDQINDTPAQPSTSPSYLNDRNTNEDYQYDFNTY